MPSRSDLFLRHFTKYLEKPFDIQVYRQQDGPPLRLATFDRAFANHRAYASLGLCERGDPVPKEAFLLADDHGKDVPLIFVNALFFIMERDIRIETGLVIGGVEMIRPDFTEYFGKSAICFVWADDFRPGLETVDLGTETGEVYQGLFVSWAEHDFIKRNGYDAFAARLQAQDADPCSLARPSCV